MPNFSKEVTDEGSRIVGELLETWSSRCASAKTDGDDVVMGNEDDVDVEISILKQCVEEYQDKISANPWVQSIIAAL